MPFNFSNKFDFLRKLTMDNEQLDVVYSAKLLGVTISTNLKWNDHTDNIIKKAKKRLCYICRLCKLGASREKLLDQYWLTVRSVMEFAVPAFAGGLSLTNIQDIEEVQI